MTRKPSFCLHWMPASVLLLGLLAAALLVWTDRINQKQRANYLLLDAIMDVQIHTSTFHLWFEQVLAGDRAVQMKEVWEDYDRAVSLVGTLLSGGESEHGFLSHPLKDPEWRAQAEEIKSRLATFKTLALERMRQPQKSGIGSDIDHRFDHVFETILVKAAGLELAVQDEQVRFQRQSGRLFLGMILVWTLIVIGAALGLLNRERRRRASEEALRLANEQLLAQAAELRGHREHLTELVDLRTKELTSANRNLTQEIAERKQTEEALTVSQKQFRHLSSQLLSAQEKERRKISRELHDELGQSLTLMKLQFRSIEKKLREDQFELRQECEDTLQYLNTVIENVRRLSRDLCPLVLEDLGLKKALERLFDNFTRTSGIRLVPELADIDRLFSGNDQASIYRIIQEALTNIVKHSGAGTAAVAVRREGGEVSVVIEDDGKGFRKTEGPIAPEARGLGLASMEERVSMLGGSLSLWSEEGRGTRITISIPVPQEKDRTESLSYHLDG